MHTLPFDVSDPAAREGEKRDDFSYFLDIAVKIFYTGYGGF